MKSHWRAVPAEPDAFTGQLRTRLELVHERVDAEHTHLDQIECVAKSYVENLPRHLKLVR